MLILVADVVLFRPIQRGALANIDGYDANMRDFQNMPVNHRFVCGGVRGA